METAQTLRLGGERLMKIDQMKRQQLEALAFRIGLQRPATYTMPELKKALKEKYRKQKERGR